MTEGADIPVASIVSFVPHAHLGFATKHRHRVLASQHLKRREQIMRGSAWTWPSSTADTGHVHLLMKFPAHRSDLRPASSLKRVSSMSGRLHHRA
jgi:REP element-mobilizing transposase RayT